MVIAVTVAIGLVLVTFTFHYAVLRTASTILPRLRISLEARVLSIVLASFVAHIIEIVLYAIALILSVEFWKIGSFGGLAVESFEDYLYFSMVSYTSLGLGDVFPHGHLRFLTGVEALNGLMLIA